MTKTRLSGGRNMILVVDDEPEICKLLSSFLKAKKFSVNVAANGRQALEELKKNKPDLIILDVKMPEMGGFELLKRLKSNPLYSTIPVIMLTVQSESRHVDKGVCLGADFYLPKPFSLDNLMMYIECISK
jgi:DNA-binding response OmpR family regulator